MYSGLALGIFGASGAGRAASLAGLALAIGALVFSGTVAALALGGPRWLGALTPIGGLLMIAGLATFVWTAATGERRPQQTP